MRYIKSYESKITEKNKKNDYLNSIKKELIENMNQNPIDIWYNLDDRLIELKDKWGTFINKYDGTTKPVIDFDDINIDIDIKEDGYYTLASISNYEWKGGKKVDLEEAKLDYSIYMSEFDDDFLRYYERYKHSKTDALSPFYSMLIGFDYAYRNSIPRENFGDNLKKATEELCKEVSRSLKRMPYKIKIHSLSYLNEKEWVKTTPSFESLEKIEYPRISLSFFVD